MDDDAIENLVDAVGAALGVDTGTIHEDKFKAACMIAKGMLAPRDPLPGDAEAKLQELLQAVRIACHNVNNGLVPLICADEPDPGALRAAVAMKALNRAKDRASR